MNTTRKDTDSNSMEDSTKESLDEASKAISINKKIEKGSNKEKNDTDEKKDEEQWRNEG